MRIQFKARVSFIIVVGLLSYAQFGFSQISDKQIKDSVLRTIEKLDHDTTKVKHLIAAGDALQYDHPTVGYELFMEAASLSSDKGYLHGEALALIRAGMFNARIGRFSQAIEKYFASLRVYEKMFTSKDSKLRAIGNHGIVDNLMVMANLYCRQGELEKFQKYALEARQHVEEHPVGDAKSAWLESEIAGCYFQNGSLEDAMLHYMNARVEFQKYNDRFGLANSNANLGMVYMELDRSDSAIYYLKASLDIYKEVNSNDGIVWVSTVIGNYFKKQGNLDSTWHYYEKAHDISVKSGVGNPTAILNMADVLYSQGKIREAIKYCHRAMEMAEAHGRLNFQAMISKRLLGAYEGLGEFEQALKYHKDYIAFRDSLRKLNDLDNLGKVEAQHEFDKALLVKDSEHQHKLDKERALADEKAAGQRKIILFITVGMILFIAFSAYIFSRMQVIRKQRDLIDKQRRTVEDKNKEILDSINYAKRIQAAILPSPQLMQEKLGDHFVLYEPKDIVSGDFYWLEEQNDKVFFAAADCTGHGVPGAMVSVVCNNGLNRSVREYQMKDPGRILDKTREIVIQEFLKSGQEVKDGMDIALCTLEQSSNKDSYNLNYAGANNPLWIIRKDSNEIEEIRPDRQPIGVHIVSENFTTHSLTVSKGDIIYIFTDGIIDQFGGDQGKKFKANRLKKLLLSIHQEDLPAQKKAIFNAFNDWKGNLDQIDDLCILGVKL